MGDSGCPFVLIAISFSEEVTVSGGADREVDMLWPVDAGNYDLTWTLVDDATNAPLTCAPSRSRAVTSRPGHHGGPHWGT